MDGSSGHADNTIPTTHLQLVAIGLLPVFLCAFLCGCTSDRHSSTVKAAATLQTPQTMKPDQLERNTCVTHQLEQDGCGEYRILSYDATWTNALGNEGAFVLERDGLTIRAHCGSESCWTWAESVGKTIIADKSITDLIIHYDPSCEDPLFVKNALEYHQRTTRKNATVATVCHQNLIVDKIEAKTPK